MLRESDSAQVRCGRKEDSGQEGSRGKAGPKEARVQAWAMRGRPRMSQPKSEKGNLKARVADNRNGREQKSSSLGLSKSFS